MIFSLAVFGWGVGMSFMLNNDLPLPIPYRWGQFSQIAALFIPAAWFHFVLVYTGRTVDLRNFLRWGYLITLAIFPFSFSKLFILGFHEMVGLKRYPIPGPAYVAFTILFITMVAYSFTVLYKAWEQSKSLEKIKEVKLLFLVQLYAFATGSLSFLPVYGIPLPQYNLLVMPAWQLILAYTMVRYGLFDLEAMAHAAQQDKLAAIGILATSINHEIRNPLYVIKGFAESYLENLKAGVYTTKEEMVAKAAEINKKTVEQAQRIIDIMARLTLFAKDRTKLGPILEEVDLAEIFNDILPLVMHELKLDKIELVNEISSEMPPIHADKRQIEEVFFNLIVNACQAMREKGGKLSVRARQRRGTIAIEIEDQGHGVPSESLAKIFHPFYTTKETGTGLGLYITRKLVEENKGRIFVWSQRNKGTRFMLSFPVSSRSNKTTTNKDRTTVRI